MADTENELETDTEKRGPPSDDEVAKARARDARAENLRKAREARWSSKKAEDKAEKSEKAEKKAAGESLSEKAMLEGCRVLVRLLWLVSRGVALLVGGRLTELADDELEAGAREAVPLARRFSALALILTFLGFPLWLFSAIGAHFAFSEPAEKPSRSATVTPINRAGGAS